MKAPRRPQLRRELVATLLGFAALYALGALLSSPTESDTHCWTGMSRFGPVGACTRSVVFTTLGPAASALFPFLPLLLAARTLDRVTRAQGRAALLFLLEAAGFIATASALVAGVAQGFDVMRRAGGVVGAIVALATASALGVVGAWLAIILGLYVAGRLTMEALGMRTPTILRPRRSVARTRVADAPLVVAAPPPVEATLAEPLPSPDLLLPTLSLAADAVSPDREALEFRLAGALRHLQLDATVVGRAHGAAVSRYEIEVSPTTPVRDLATLERDVGAALRSSRVRVAPIAGQVAIGIELPNGAAPSVSLRELIDSAEFHDASRALPIALGRDLAGRTIIADLAKMPHLLIAGDAGSGKTVALNVAITSLVYRHAARAMRLLLIDTDEAGLGVYDQMPHLWGGVVCDYRAAASAIEAAADEALARFELLAASGARNLQDFNQRVAERSFDAARCAPHMPLLAGRYDGAPLPHLVVAIDDAADLLRAAPEVERPLLQLATRARTAGIHLMAVTKRPMASAFRANFLASFPARAALRAADANDSITMIERAGAETLLGNGDLLFLPPGRSEPIRMQAPLVSAEDTRRLVQWFAERGGTVLAESAKSGPTPAASVTQAVVEAANESPVASTENDRSAA